MSTSPVQQSLTPKQLPLFERKYQLQITLPPQGGNQQVLTLSDSNFEPEALRFTFDIGTYWFQYIWYADIAIWNLDFSTTQQILQGAGPQGGSVDAPPAGNVPVRQGMTVKVSAGYVNGNYGVIWDAPVFQAWFERENVTDFKLILRCLYGLDDTYRATVSSTYAALLSQSDIIQKIAKDAFIPNPTFSASISKNKLSRGKVIFGNPAKYFSQIASDNNMQWFRSQQGLVLARIDDSSVSAKDPIVYTPMPQANGPVPAAGSIPGLIGVPVQTQDGVDFRILLNPNVACTYPATQVKIDLTSIIQLKKSVGQLPAILDQSGTYIVAGARYIGDTRGGPWYTEVKGLTSVGGKLAMAKLALANLGTYQ